MKKKESGQTLLEALIALSTAVIIISAMTVMVLSSLNNAQFSKNQNQATQYAQQGIEVLKNTSQSDWTAFAVNNGSYCLSQDSTTLIQTPVSPGCAQSPYIINNLFVRDVVISQYLAGDITTIGYADCQPTSVTRAKVTVTVSWSDNKCTSAMDPYCHKIPLVSCIYNSTTILPP
ncbi:MAG: hypothetical protein A3H50_00095 [Candidatus Levybacteria bacterium RIFCSPLOWO2_02_FULL_37_10]|nr:MAG: hypothetical protein A2860_01510 [Candidatus Levybacteria bacterium RIFCSPHIGHO2_01_FULL_37_33]OGH29330.1 MAG: hypothetical protein A3F30_02230 [Candidatus Levybacteria bacterium RIFCSPHIGHO2_12_FULL_37_12]OGH32452.1 MAG: hypothetical protein A2953_01685 [Candidatus Levybacteria bacterium RIFCSPLOWO2_01_FULL_36_54]OGH43265.1 MAG: hypothetical protein A3H50_00095 [Candidatus Levybacteria bacterium RIFCSPLOWO2_02_FULL_37_10]